MRNKMEILANFGLILVAVGIVSPLFGMESSGWYVAFKWVFTIGAGFYTIARLVGAFEKDENFRVRRLRRMEVWAGIAFCVAAFFWFYNTGKIDSNVLTFPMLQETIVFTLAGALIQIAASWMLNSALRKKN